MFRVRPVKPTKIKKIKAVRLTIQYYQGDINKNEILLISHIKNNLVLKFEKKVVSWNIYKEEVRKIFILSHFLTTLWNAWNNILNLKFSLRVVLQHQVLTVITIYYQIHHSSIFNITNTQYPISLLSIQTHLFHFKMPIN